MSPPTAAARRPRRFSSRSRRAIGRRFAAKRRPRSKAVRRRDAGRAQCHHRAARTPRPEVPGRGEDHFARPGGEDRGRHLHLYQQCGRRAADDGDRVVQKMSGESAQRAALGAGAIVIDVLAANDGRLPHEKIERIRPMRPDMILMAGGTDGGAVTMSWRWPNISPRPSRAPGSA